MDRPKRASPCGCRAFQVVCQRKIWGWGSFRSTKSLKTWELQTQTIWPDQLSSQLKWASSIFRALGLALGYSEVRRLEKDTQVETAGCPLWVWQRSLWYWAPWLLGYLHCKVAPLLFPTSYLGSVHGVQEPLEGYTEFHMQISIYLGLGEIS